jgi:hypothetical protein
LDSFGENPPVMHCSPLNVSSGKCSISAQELSCSIILLILPA